MSLLSDLMTNTVDAGYREAADRRKAAGPVPRPSGARPSLLVGLALIGLVLAAAAGEAHSRAGSVESARSRLAAEVTQRTSENDRMTAQVDQLRREIDRARHDALVLSSDGAAAAEQLRTLTVVTGAAAVTGPGLVVTVDDAKDVGAAGGAGSPRDQGEQDTGRVQDSDLQRVVNGLWQAGAEAISINGQRLTSLTAIRSAEAILVAYRPLSPPYVVSAIGDSNGLAVGFADGDTESYLQVLAQNYGIRYDIRQAKELPLPAGSGVTLRYAERADSGRRNSPPASTPAPREGPH